MGKLHPPFCYPWFGVSFTMGLKTNQGHIKFGPSTITAKDFQPFLHSRIMKNLHHLLEKILGKDIAFMEAEFFIEFISRLVSHSSTQSGTELLTLTVPHVVYLKMTPSSNVS